MGYPKTDQVTPGTHWRSDGNRKPGGRRAPSALEPSGNRRTTHYPQSASSNSGTGKSRSGASGGALGQAGRNAPQSTYYRRIGDGGGKQKGEGSHNASAGRVRGT